MLPFIPITLPDFTTRREHHQYFCSSLIPLKGWMVVVLCLMHISYAGTICHPNVDPRQAQYLIGYGSLMATASRHRTAPEIGEGLPVRVQGINRAWFMQADMFGAGTTFLGASRKANTRMNAVIFRLPATSVTKYDARERSYCRYELPHNDLEVLTGVKVPDGQIWVYVTTKDQQHWPDAKHPIVQSYVDLFLTGCMEQAEAHQLPQFLAECITTTHHWPSDWVNDRLHPRRPFADEPQALVFDRLLQQKISKPFSHRHIE